MALRMIVGKPGGGKSYRALMELVDELLNGERVVVTNLPLILGELNAYLSEQAPEKDINIFERVVLLNEAQTKRFWLYRGPNVEVPDVTKIQEKAGEFPDFAQFAGPGVLYVIDEAHIPFDARAWADAGQSLTYYNSQHRKLNDELIFITQFLELIDKRIRGFAQEFWYARNNGMEKVMTFFKMPSYFSLSVYQRPPTGMMDRPSEVHRFTLDLKIARCYDTSAGVGISGRKRPEKKKTGGLSIGWLALPVVGLAAGLWYAPSLAGKAIGGAAESFDEGFAGELLPVVSPSSERSEVLVSVASEVPSLVVGYAVNGNRVAVFLADGTVLTDSDDELERVEANRVRISGEWHKLPRARVVNPADLL